MSARYHPDHTAHIRQRLATMAVRGAFGLVVAAAAAAVIALIGTRTSGGASAVLARVVWIADIALAGVSVITLVVTAVMWLVYRRRRAGLDAPGAEIIDQLKDRRASPRPAIASRVDHVGVG